MLINIKIPKMGKSTIIHEKNSWMCQRNLSSFENGNKCFAKEFMVELQTFTTSDYLSKKKLV